MTLFFSWALWGTYNNIDTQNRDSNSEDCQRKSIHVSIVEKLRVFRGGGIMMEGYVERWVEIMGSVYRRDDRNDLRVAWLQAANGNPNKLNYHDKRGAVVGQIAPLFDPPFHQLRVVDRHPVASARIFRIRAWIVIVPSIKAASLVYWHLLLFAATCFHALSAYFLSCNSYVTIVLDHHFFIG